MSPMLVLVTLSLHRILPFFIDLLQHIAYGWVAMPLLAQRYFLHNKSCCLHITEIAFITGGSEVKEHTCIFTCMRFWLQKLPQDFTNDISFIRIKHTVTLGLCRFLIFSSYGHDSPRVPLLKLECGPIVQKCCSHIALTAVLRWFRGSCLSFVSSGWFCIVCGLSFWLLMIFHHLSFVHAGSGGRRIPRPIVGMSRLVVFLLSVAIQITRSIVFYPF